ncbi:Htaa protein [Lentzea fradiae]|uniref:Htaa protein n=1 Tax=Lentzea fradiae TaxID=200378 RepID=A0A1G7R3N3_9PSEU|nr:HtaA domain-containing protein [Lentzea fradiae]SDG05382.1 Htaa protein [Lentzea fradiae]
MSVPVLASLVLLAAQGPVTTTPTTTSAPPPGPSSSVTTTAPSSTSSPATSSSPAPSSTPEVAARTAAESCELTPDNVRSGELVWGLKKSFRQYVGIGLGGAVGNSITATGGATITALDEIVVDGVANPKGVATGAYRFTFDSADYTSPTRFTAKFRGTVTFSYPGHLFSLIVSNPQVSTADGKSVVHADIELKASEGAPAAPANLPGVEFGRLTTPAATPADGLLTWKDVPATLASSEAFGGFYNAGTDLDPLTMHLGADCAAVPAPPQEAVVTPPAAQPAENLVPDVQFRPDGTSAPALASTGADVEHTLWAGVVTLLAGLAFVLAAYRPRTRTRP